MQTIIVDMTPGYRMPTIYFSQGDVGTQFAIDLRSRFGDSLPASPTVTIQATKPSGFGFTVAATSLTNGVAVFTTTAEMTDEAGRFPAELKVVKDNVTLFSANFGMEGEANTHPAGTIDGSQETVIPELTQLVERAEDAASSVLDRQTVTNTLPAGSQATYSFDEGTNTQTFGIPQGEAGAGAAGVTASAYSASKTYAVGDYVIHNSNLYRCTTAITTAEAFTAAHWTQVVLADDVSDVKSDLTYTDSAVFDDNTAYEKETISNGIINSSGILISIGSGNTYTVSVYPLAPNKRYTIELLDTTATGFRIGFTNTNWYYGQTLDSYVNVKGTKYTFDNSNNYLYLLVNKSGDTYTSTPKLTFKADKLTPISESLAMIEDDIYDNQSVTMTERINFVINTSGVFYKIGSDGTYTIAQFPIEPNVSYTIKATGSGISKMRIAFANVAGYDGLQLSDMQNLSETEYIFKNEDGYKYLFVNKNSDVFPAVDVELTAHILANSTSIMYVAASDSSASDKNLADYVCDGSHDEVEIQSAIDALNEYGGTVHLLKGTYNIDGFSFSGTNSSTGDSWKVAFGVRNSSTQKAIVIESDGTPMREYGGKNAAKSTAVINVTDTALTALDSYTGRASVIGYEGSVRIYPKYSLTVKNIAFLLADNQHAINVIDGKFYSEYYVENVFCFIYSEGTGTDEPSYSLPNPSCVAIRGTDGSNMGAGYRVSNCFVFGFGTAYAMNGEHLIMEQCGTRFCDYSYVFGTSDNVGANLHDITLINCCHEFTRRYPVFNNYEHQAYNLINYNVEEATTGDFAHISLAVAIGNPSGNIDFTCCDNDTWANKSRRFFENGQGEYFKVRNNSHKLIGASSDIPSAPNPFETFYDTTTSKYKIFANGSWVDLN